MRSSEHIDHLLQDLLDEELEAEQAATVRRHLETCERCSRQWAALQSVAADVRALPRSIEPPSDLWGGIRARLDVTAGADEGAGGAAEVRAGDAGAGEIQGAGAGVGTTLRADAGVDAGAGARDADAAADSSFRRQAHRGGRPAAFEDRSPRTSSAGIPRSRTARTPVRLAAAVVMLVAAAGVVWLLTRSGGAAWEVEPLGGAPRVAQVDVIGQGVLRPGQWLETDGDSRARVRIGAIGEVDVDANSRIQLKRAQLTDHRIALAEGRIEARIWAPPRLFFVETPSATAIDLGCAYTLDVDSTGRSILHVTSGYVELEREGRSSVVPAGAMCYATPADGPGTVFSEDASPALRDALQRYDFAGAQASDLDVILEEARRADALTLWQLVERSDGERREAIYRKLLDLVHPPSGVTQEGIMGGDEAMFQMWRLHLGLDAMGWWGYLQKKLSFPE